jgi:pectate lyase
VLFGPVDETLVAGASVALPVFPGAEGFGTATPAGSGRHLSSPDTAIYRVTNLNSSGPGSLREAVEASGPRTVVFEVSGTIEDGAYLTIRNPYITIAGQTAPSPGITLKGTTLRIWTHDVLIRHLRIRVGDKGGVDPDSRDGIAIFNGQGRYDVYNVVVDHCSVSWAIDGCIDITQDGIHDVTVSNCFVTETLDNSIHPEGRHSRAMLIRDCVERISVHHTLFAHNDRRNPRVVPPAETELVNNVVYNWERLAFCYGPGDGSRPPMFSNAIGNYYKEGLDRQINGPILVQDSLDPLSKVYVQGNIGPNRPADSLPEWDIAEEGDETTYRSNTPVVTRAVQTVLPAEQAFDHVLDHSGARPRDRDAVDERIVNDVRNGTGHIINSQDEVGGWPVLAENHRTLDLPSNPNSVGADGYTNLEAWLDTYAKEIEGLEDFDDGTVVLSGVDYDLIRQIVREEIEGLSVSGVDYAQIRQCVSEEIAGLSLPDVDYAQIRQCVSEEIAGLSLPGVDYAMVRQIVSEEIAGLSLPGVDYAQIRQIVRQEIDATRLTA